MPQAGSVVVVIPAKDRAAVIGRAIASIQAQTVPPAEVIVVDDGSTDDTAAIARSSGATVLAHETSRGSGAARNTAIEASDAEWVAFLDSDDEWLPEHLEVLLASAGDHVLVSSSAVDTNGRGRGNVRREPLRLTPRRCFVPENPVVTSAVLARRSELVAAGGFGTFRRAQDVDMWARLLRRGSGVALSRPTVVYHVPSGPPDAAGAARDHEGLSAVLASSEDQPWMSPSVLRAIGARYRWDDMRRCVRERAWAQAVTDGAWIARRPTTWVSLLHVLWLRRLSREARWQHFLERRALGSSRAPG